MLWILSLLSCSQPAPECPDVTCPEPGLQVEPWERALLEPVIEEIRGGVTLEEGSFGVCEGRASCDAFLGTDPGELAVGQFMVRAEVRAPAVGEDWKVKFQVDCSIGDRALPTHEKVYPVTWTGQGRGFRLQPLWTIQSPHPSGARDCRYSLTPLRGDAPTGEAWTGSYRTPAEEQ